MQSMVGVLCIKTMDIQIPEHDTVPRVNNLYCFYVKDSPKTYCIMGMGKQRIESVHYFYHDHPIHIFALVNEESRSMSLKKRIPFHIILLFLKIL